MNRKEILKDAEIRMKKSVEAIREDMAKIRTGRASTALLDHLKVDYYGNPTQMNQVATVSVSDARTLAVTPWDKSIIPLVEKSIMESDLGLNPVTAGEVIRIRNIRRDANHHLKELLKNKEVAEDEEKKALEDIQRLTDQYVEQIDSVVADKEAEIMEV